MHAVRDYSGLAKKNRYQELIKELRATLENEPDALANLSNAAALVAQALDRINWCGFYLLRGNELVLGPFQGKPGFVRIPLGRGVCGTAALQQRTLVVPDVLRFAGHIACDPDSRSEVAVPLLEQDELRGVLDIDSPDQARFDDHDRAGLEEFARTLVPLVRWDSL
jgi:L-methionine (R)-S-oxide reductase